jgi:hypothetical protein
MATEFVKGQTYGNSATQYGLRPYDIPNDQAAASEPSLTWLCCSVTKTFVVFKQLQPTGSGATANPGMLLGTTQRLRIRRDSTGKYVSPLGRKYGMVIVRP